MKNLIYRYQIQKNIFKEKLSSTDLLNISLKNSSNPISKNINVWMNHNFETILTYMKPYFNYPSMFKKNYRKKLSAKIQTLLHYNSIPPNNELERVNTLKDY